MKRPWIAAAAAAVMALSACGSSGSNNDVALVTPTTATPATAPAGPTTVAALAPKCVDGKDGNATESYTPLATLPVPNAMPAGSFMKTIQDHGHLKVGVSADTLLFGARNPLNGKMEGFDIDMLREVAQAIFGGEIKDIDAKIEFKVITYAQRIPSLQDGSVDIVAHTMTINCTRWNVMAFSSEYYSAGQKLMAGKLLAGSGVKGLADLAGHTVCVARGSTNEQEVAKYPQVKAFKVDDLTDCVVAFQQGQADVVTGDDTVLLGFAKQDPYAQILPDAFTSEPYGLGIAKDHVDFVRFVNAVLQGMRTDGRWTNYYKEWVTPNLPAGTAVPKPPVARYGRPDAALAR
ncbi:MAG: glutamate transporter substrate-binding protein [Acidimicrobiia bacterium]|nr:glutamate transporter substrate-binding protein [Acidimicrobiia bacterium]